jgi:hypothetical protein
MSINKVLVLTGSDEPMWGVLDETIPSKQKYVKERGYDLMVVRSFPGDKECRLEERHIGFQRAALAFKLLKFYDAVMWIDADSVITNTSYKIEDFIRGNECYIASYDWMHYNSFSTGNFIVRRTPNVQNFFNLFLQVSRIHLEGIGADQSTFNQIYRDMPDQRENFGILDHRYLNAVPSFLVETQTWKNDNNRTGIVAPWTSDCFLAHFTGTDNQERIELIKNNKLGI